MIRNFNSMKNTMVFLLTVFLLFSCSETKKQEKALIDEDKLGFIDADVESEETNLKSKAEFGMDIPGQSEVIERAFENAPPMIPHTTINFFPITRTNNICFSCHLPERVEETKAVPIPPTHFTDLRPDMGEKGGIYYTTFEGEMAIAETKNFNNAYFNCSQCHVPLSNVTVNIENLFTPEFRDVLSRDKSQLKDKLKEGISE
ncbi:nitrate reductase cytochrome c-type subunit [Prolixibacteraceae bacterium Z1-6]|uniref:Periplasmic nitrate reductase, electron transfer subunit n=1 Tax=Draconibacterium aestuarii TaxID=2998507 RepID=A0A9X3F5Y8_9BACT|nr:nitrate reductase cytochrome c-type subunit [Prolixibacteraceae bacterium Z1-6]